MNYYIQGDAANADKIKAAFEKLGVYVGGYDFGRKDVLFFTFEAKGKTHLMSSVFDTGLDNIILTHPDYKELKLPVEPKFKVRDWVVCWDRTYQILDNKSSYLVREIDGLVTRYEHSTVDENGRLWTIKDAKDGDVLAAHECYVIFKEIDGLNIKCYCTYHYMGFNPSFHIDTLQNKNAFKPAIDVERGMLFAKMKEAGYQWDEVNKELKKIQSHYDIANFHAGMPVLVRDNDEHKWLYTIFGIYNKDNPVYPFVVVNMRGYFQCIPYNDNTKHLLGATDMCPEEYINW